MIEPFTDEVWINIVEDEESRVSRRWREVMKGAGERSVQRCISKRRAADTEDDDILKSSLHGGGVFEDGIMNLLLVWEIHPT